MSGCLDASNKCGTAIDVPDDRDAKPLRRLCHFGDGGDVHTARPTDGGKEKAGMRRRAQKSSAVDLPWCSLSPFLWSPCLYSNAFCFAGVVSILASALVVTQRGIIAEKSRPWLLQSAALCRPQAFSLFLSSWPPCPPLPFFSLHFLSLSATSVGHTASYKGKVEDL